MLAGRDFSVSEGYSPVVKEHSTFTCVRRCISSRMATWVVTLVANDVRGFCSLVSVYELKCSTAGKGFTQNIAARGMWTERHSVTHVYFCCGAVLVQLMTSCTVASSHRIRLGYNSGHTACFS